MALKFVHRLRTGNRRAAEVSLQFMVTSLELEAAAARLLNNGVRLTRRNVEGGARQLLHMWGDSLDVYIDDELNNAGVTDGQIDEAARLVPRLFPEAYQ